MESLLVSLTRRARLTLQEFAPQLVLLMLHGRYLTAGSGLVQRHWLSTLLRT
jgi:hypothetical protein